MYVKAPLNTTKYWYRSVYSALYSLLSFVKSVPEKDGKLILKRSNILWLRLGNCSGPDRPLGELGDRLGRRPLRDDKNATKKEKGAEKWKINCHTPQGPSDGGGEGTAGSA